MGDKPMDTRQATESHTQTTEVLALGLGVGQNAPEPGSGSALWQFGYSADALRRFLSDERRQSSVEKNAQADSESQNRFLSERGNVRWDAKWDTVCRISSLPIDRKYFVRHN